MSAHANSVKEWKDRAKTAEQELARARNTVRLLETMLNDREQQIRNLQIELLANSGAVELEGVPDDYDDDEDEIPVRTFDNVAEARAYVEEREALGFDVEVEIEAEGFHLHGISAAGDVLDPDALRVSIEKIKDTHPEHYARLVEEHADVMRPELKAVE